MAESWIQTFTGGKFSFDNIEQNEIDILDIAHALSNQCRFSGHVRYFYSIAEHSYHCSFLVPAEYALDALLHDASEAYIVDVPKPLKYLLPDYCRIEDRVMAHIASVFGIQYPFHESIKAADIAMLYAERNCLLTAPPQEWSDEHVTPANVVIRCWNPETAKQHFVDRLFDLLGAREVRQLLERNRDD